MAENDADEIVIGANGKVLVGAVGATAPTDPTSIPAGFEEVGYLNEDGLTPTDSKTMETIRVWQSLFAARRVITERDFAVAFVMRQWNLVTVPLAFGGGEIEELATGIYAYNPPAPETIDERSMIFDWVDGDRHYRIYIPRGMVTENVETNIVRGAASDLPITFSVNGQEGEQPWRLITDDPAFAAIVGP